MGWPVNLDKLDLNSLPIWLLTVVVVLALLPRIMQGLSLFIPALASHLEAQRERQEALLHHRLDSDAANQQQQIKIQDRMLSILEDNLKKAWEDRDQSHRHLEAIQEQISELRRVTLRGADILSVHTASVNKMADEVEGLKGTVGNLSERMNSLGSWVLEINRIRGHKIGEG